LERHHHQTKKKLFLQDYFDDGSGKAPRSIRTTPLTLQPRRLHQDRVLLVMATDAGKTYTAFQIIWRLWNVTRGKLIRRW
jgi:type I restriction enzyme R subunit